MLMQIGERIKTDDLQKDCGDAESLHLYLHEVPNRDHGSLMGKILDQDDQVLRLVIDFVLRN